MENLNYMTEKGLTKLKEELNYLVSVERPAISQQIAEARDKGDLSENAEYDAAKEKQGLIEMQISKLQLQIRNARIIDASNLGTDSISVLNKVKLKNNKTKAIIEYTIVPESEANLKEKKLSVETPIAKGLLGKSKGEIVTINVPAGQLELTILDVSL